MTKAGLPVLTYHAIDRRGSVTSTEPTRFDETLHAFDEAGFRCVDLEGWIAAGRPALDRAYAITFDDGLSSMAHAAESLARYRATATVFLVTGRIGEDNDWPGQPGWVPRERLLDWSEIESLRAYGFRFAAHGESHAKLDDLDDATLVDEISRSRLALEDHLGAPCRLFAYPYGAASARVRRAVAEHFEAAFTTRLDLARAAESPHRISRIDAFYLRDDAVVNRIIAGRCQAWLDGRRALREFRHLVTHPFAKLADTLANHARHDAGLALRRSA